MPITEVNLKAYEPVEDLQHNEAVIKVSKADLDNVNFVDGTTTFSFFNCYFNKLIIENAEEIDFKDISIAFFGCFIREIQVTSITSKNISVGFYGSMVSGKIENSHLTSVELNNCLVNSLFLIKIASVRVTFTKENSQLYRWKNLITPLAGKYKQLFELKNTYYINECQKIQYSSNFKKDPKKRKFNISLNLDFGRGSADVNTSISDGDFNSLSLSGKPQAKIDIYNVQVNSWYIYDFVPAQEISFYNISSFSLTNSNTKIGIHQSILDNAWFDNIDFNNFERISLYRSKLSKATFTSCTFPNTYTTFERFMPIENVHYPDRKSANHHKDLYEIFLQLKKSVEGTGNYYESQKIQTMAHEALRRVNDIPRWDRFILGINRLSNDHGQSIKRPFLIFLGLSIVFYILYLWSLGRMFNCNGFDADLIGYYFAFIDVTHRTDFLVDKNEFNVGSLFLDYFSKILHGFFIYQFIAAFRKYGKK